jgi:N-methylhydantoinase B/oxoprolinase/acetone carboxylase alpha subunit
MTVWRGLIDDDAGHDYFTLTSFGAGGSGGRPRKDGLTTTGFPTGVRAAPTEVLEAHTPIVQTSRELLADSAGAGEYRGGVSQTLRVRRRGKGAWSVNANVDRVDYPAPGADGGRDGSRGSFTRSSTGEPLPRKSQVFLGDDDEVTLHFPGGGGHGDPYVRPVERVLQDVIDGYVSIDRARSDYGVAITYEGLDDAIVRTEQMYRVDREATVRLRSG